MLGIQKPFRIENHTLVINHDAIRGMEPFASILKRKRTTKGDHDGRKKIVNFAELMYIYFMVDPSSYHRGLPKKEQHMKAKEDAGLPDNWKPDELIIEGKKKYKEVIDTYIPVARNLISLERGLSMTSLAVDSYCEQMEELLEINKNLMKEIKADPTAATEQTTVLVEANQFIRTNIKEILAIAKELPSVTEKLSLMQEQLRKEEGSAKELVGGRKKRRREDPK